MNKVLIIALIFMCGCGVPQGSSPIEPTKPLLSHLPKPNAEWQKEYANEPNELVAMVYTTRLIIDVVNQQASEIRALKAKLAAPAINEVEEPIDK